jgi:hypothetical protein
VVGRLGLGTLLRYAAFDKDDNGIPVDNLDEVPIQGLVKFRRERDVRFGGKQSRDYESAAVHSPTWLTICVLADASIVISNDRHHVELVGVRVIDLAPLRS